MNCPNCGKEMKLKKRYQDRTRPYEGFWTESYVAKILHYSCKDCKIKREIDSDIGGDKWTLPKEMRPTEKQIAYAEKIIKRLGLDSYEYREILVTKQQYWKFINDHKDEMDKIMKKHQDAWKNCNYGDWCDEYYFSACGFPEIGINGF